MSEEDFFEKYGLKVDSAVPELDTWYPFYGMITAVLDEQADSMTVELNFNIKMTIYSEDEDNRNKIKEKALESGIFIAKITKINEVEDTEEDYQYEAECKTVIFGRPQLNKT